MITHTRNAVIVKNVKRPIVIGVKNANSKAAQHAREDATQFVKLNANVM